MASQYNVEEFKIKVAQQCYKKEEIKFLSRNNKLNIVAKQKYSNAEVVICTRKIGF